MRLIFFISLTFFLSSACFAHQVTVQVDDETYHCGEPQRDFKYGCECTDSGVSYSELNYMKIFLDTGEIEEIREIKTYWGETNLEAVGLCHEAIKLHPLCN